MEINFNYVIQGLVAVVIIGVYLNLLSVTKVYGGVIGAAVKMFGLGTLFITLGIIEGIMVDLEIVAASTNMTLIQHIFNLLGVVFLGLGFARLASGTKV